MASWTPLTDRQLNWMRTIQVMSCCATVFVIDTELRNTYTYTDIIIIIIIIIIYLIYFLRKVVKF